MEGAITADASNFCINGNVATNGTIVSSGNININGTKTENANERLIFIFDKIEETYFSNNDVIEISENYILEETNININTATDVDGETKLTGNININTALKATDNIILDGDVKNTNNSIICTKYGDILIDSQNVTLNGLIYAPFGDVIITAQNLNLNNVIIISNTITFHCPNVNANSGTDVAKFVGNISGFVDISYSEWQYLPDSNADGIPDFIDDFSNWQFLIDTDSDILPDCIEEYLATDSTNADTDNDGLPDSYEFFMTGSDYLLYDTLGEGLSDSEYDFDEDNLSNFEEYSYNTSPLHPDSDGDSLLDYDEINIHKTNPLMQDTDDDGVLDCDENIYQNLNYYEYDFNSPEILRKLPSLKV